MIDADEITALLARSRANASAESLYQKSSRFEIGKPLPIEAKGGEPLDRGLERGRALRALRATRSTSTASAGQRIEIVKDGVFAQAWATKQFADYLGTRPTGGFANWELPAGKTPLADLLGGEERVLSCGRSRGSLPMPARGNFGSEIRVGYLTRTACASR